MIEYLQHLKAKHLNKELMIDFIMPAAYDWLVEQGWVKEDLYKDYMYSASMYRQHWLNKRPITLAEMKNRVKIHDPLKKSKEEDTIRLNIAKKMAVYDFVEIMIEIEPKKSCSNRA